ncbi:glycosyltransferase family 4 protein [Sediminicoccus rosea]|uniref:Glycosyltransferase family 4 protein n=1 Tax=Sediminicoccus rosea TaxID=1225128 RepID=A0ABZ0PFR3_9PROT|nr:glycosyltransferase family 4 protein [Sediminicoccus rosea]WPB84311.1 glycosyltransferase family 4 protein [Sediminicoccus rosea]
MQLLFFHQNFPGQYRHLAVAMARRKGTKVIGLGQTETPSLPGITQLRYKPPEPGKTTPHPYLVRTEGHIRHGQAAARAALELRRKGFRPDIICAHPGWGEGLFLKDVFPEAKMILYWEYFFRSKGGDIGFDPPGRAISLDEAARTRVQNTIQLIQLDAADWGISPTRWQWSRYPEWARSRISVIHEGIDTAIASPRGQASFTLPDGRTLTPEDEVTSFVARNLEPYRGFPQFMRALPSFQKLRPKAQVVVVGGDGVSYGRAPAEGGSWREVMLRELDGRLDLSRIHFVGRVPYAQLLNLFRLTRAHLYLTYPFVLSWSMLDAMACGAAILGSATAPVQEVIQDGINGRLVDFFQPDAIAEALAGMLANPEAQAPLKAAARRHVETHYDLHGICLPRQIALLDAIAAGQPAPDFQG